jgi:hypothetical protein
MDVKFNRFFLDLIYLRSGLKVAERVGLSSNNEF